MTLNVTASEINIKNSAGTVKFTSANKLVYQRYYQIGFVSCGASSVWVPFYTLQDQEFLVINIKILSGTGQPDLITNISNKIFPANGPILVDFYGRNVDNQAAADSELLGVDAVENSLVFKSYRLDNRNTLSAGTTTVDLMYYARVWSYL